MTGLAVETDDLLRTARELARAGERVGAAAARLSSTGPSSAGSPGLADALDDFAGHWRHGLRLLGEAADLTSAQLREAARGYTATDRAVAEACR